MCCNEQEKLNSSKIKGRGQIKLCCITGERNRGGCGVWAKWWVLRCVRSAELFLKSKCPLLFTASVVSACWVSAGVFQSSHAYLKRLKVRWILHQHAFLCDIKEVMYLMPSCSSLGIKITKPKHEAQTKETCHCLKECYWWWQREKADTIQRENKDQLKRKLWSL